MPLGSKHPLDSVCTVPGGVKVTELPPMREKIQLFFVKGPLAFPQPEGPFFLHVLPRNA